VRRAHSVFFRRPPLTQSSLFRLTRHSRALQSAAPRSVPSPSSACCHDRTYKTWVQLRGTRTSSDRAAQFSPLENAMTVCDSSTAELPISEIVCYHVSLNHRGEVSERLKELASKASVGEILPWVRIPPSPPFSLSFCLCSSNSAESLEFGAIAGSTTQGSDADSRVAESRQRAAGQHSNYCALEGDGRAAS
jgi:hypothetical protein